MSEMTQFLTGYGGPLLFAIVFVEQPGLPLPSAPWLLAAGALSASGKLNPAVAVGVTTLGAMMADSLWFYVGRRGGQRVLQLFCRLSLSRNSCVGRTKGLFARHGFKTLVAAKFLPGLGTVMPPLAGALGISASRFLFFDALGSLFYGGFYISAGFLFHNQLTQVMALLSRLGLGVLLFGLLGLAGYVGYKLARRDKLETAKSQTSKNGNHGVASLPAERLSVSALQGVTLAVTASRQEEVKPNSRPPLLPCTS